MLAFLAQKIVRIYVSLRNRTARHDSCYRLPRAGGYPMHRFEHVIIRLWARVPCFTRACTAFSVSYFLPKPAWYESASSKYFLYRTSLCAAWDFVDAGVRAPATATSASLLPLYFSFVLLCFLPFDTSYYHFVCSINLPPMVPFRKNKPEQTR